MRTMRDVDADYVGEGRIYSVLRANDGRARLHIHSEGLYLIRDVFDADNKFLTCQFATLDADGDIEWSDCPEGVMFADIRPLMAPERAEEAA